MVKTDLDEGKPMSDYDEIRNLLASYSHYADDENYEAYADNYTEDGALVESGIVITPREKIRELARRASELSAQAPQPSGSKHLQMNSAIQVTGDKATALTDLLVIRLDPERGWYIRGSGRYRDQLVKEEGRWRFKRREVTWFKNFGLDPLHPEHEAALVGLLKGVMSTE
jgi:hypothetical protein